LRFGTEDFRFERLKLVFGIGVSGLGLRPLEILGLISRKFFKFEVCCTPLSS